MRRIALIFGCLVALAGQAMAQPFPQTLPPSTVFGRLGISPGPGQAIPFATLQGILVTGGEATVNDVNYALVAADRTVAYTALSAARTVTLLSASAYLPGTKIYLLDRSGSASATKTISLAPTGADLINGANASTVAINGPFILVIAETDGISKWVVSIPIASGSAASGDLSGTFPNPTVAKINGVSLGTTTATSGNLLIGSGTQWATQAMSSEGSITSGGAFSLSRTFSPTMTGNWTFNPTSGANTFQDGNTPTALEPLSWGRTAFRASSMGTSGVDQFAFYSQMNIAAPTGATVAYEKGAAILWCQTVDVSSAHNFDCVGVDARGWSVSGNTLARVWGGVFESNIVSGSDGQGVAGEFESFNSGSDQASVGTTTSKYALRLIADGSVSSTAAIQILSGTSTFHKGVYADTSALANGASDSFLELNGKFRVFPQTGATAVGWATALGTSPFSVHAATDQNFFVSGATNVTGAVTIGSVNDANGAFKPLEIIGSTINFEPSPASTTSASGAAWNDINFAASTLTLTGTTTVTTLHHINAAQPTITDASAVTVTDADTVFIANAPVAGGSVTITNAWALRVGAGNVKFAGTGNAVGTITSGTWNGSLITGTFGGTGVNNGSNTITVAGNFTVATNGGTLAFGAASKTLTVNKSLTLDGIDTTTMTFPSTSQTIAGLAVSGQTFTTAQTITASATSGLSGLTVNATQTQPNSSDTADGAAFLNWTLTASSATNELVPRVFKLSATNNLTGGGAISDMRIFNLTMNSNASTTTTSVEGIYIEQGTAAGTVTAGYGIWINSVLGTTKWSIYDPATSNGFYTANGVSIGTTTAAGTGNLLVNGTVTLTNLATDNGHTTRTVCQDTTSKSLFFGSGAAGVCVGTSSVRFKHDIAPLVAGLDQIEKLQAVTYKLNADHGDPDKILYGFTAEQGASVLPDLVGRDNGGQPQTFDYMGVVPVLVRAVQQLKADNDNLRAEIRAIGGR